MSMYADIIERVARVAVSGKIKDKDAIELCVDIMNDLEWLTDEHDEKVARDELRDTIRQIRKLEGSK